MLLFVLQELTTKLSTIIRNKHKVTTKKTHLLLQVLSLWTFTVRTNRQTAGSSGETYYRSPKSSAIIIAWTWQLLRNLRSLIFALGISNWEVRNPLQGLQELVFEVLTKFTGVMGWCIDFSLLVVIVSLLRFCARRPKYWYFWDLETSV